VSALNALTRVWDLRAELLQALALLAGWLLVTFGLVELTTPKVWPLSIGLLLLSLCGWKWLASLFGHGLYTLVQVSQASDEA
jgi:hypothetical protein